MPRPLGFGAGMVRGVILAGLGRRKAKVTAVLRCALLQEHGDQQLEHYQPGVLGLDGDQAGEHSQTRRPGVKLNHSFSVGTPAWFIT
jgi:hypothetical protein